MKKLVFLLLIAYLFLFTGKTNAIEPNQTKIDKTINLVASIAAKLKLVEKRGVIGVVTDVADTKITLADLNNNTRFVDVDEFTKFSSPSAKEGYGISDIKKGNKLGILGLYNKQSRRILGRFVDALVIPKMIEGGVLEIDEENFTVTIVSEDKNQTLVDIEKITKTSSYDKKEGLLRSGFSKIQQGERIMAVGFPDQKEKDLPAGRQGRLIASRIIHFPNIPRNPKIKLDVSQPAPVSTGSGKKLTPITR